MAANYEQFKNVWGGFNDEQKKQYAEQYKNDSTFQQFSQQYNSELNGNNNQGTNTPPSNTNNSNSNNGNGTNGGSGDYLNYYSNPETKTEKGTNTNNQDYYNNGYSSDGRNGDGNTYGRTTFDKDEQLDRNMFNQDPGEIRIQEGRGAETGRPDYEIDTPERLKEMADNIDHYYQTMPSIFNSRESFNKFFEYNDRASAKQRELLDSYWKKTQDINAATNYTTGDSVVKGLANGEITPDIMNMLKQYNEPAYIAWQKAQQDQINLNVANLAVPTTPDDIATAWFKIAGKYGLMPGDPYQIYDNWVGRCEELGVFNENNRLNNLISEMESVKNERTAAISRTMQEGAGRKSQALINAEVAKTSAIYDARFADLQTEYNSVYNKRQQNLAIANQSAQELYMQGQEDTRVFNQKISALGFAQKAYDYRSPEQKAQLELQKKQIENNMSLLQKSQENDLALYNKYATAKLENQLEYELSDLNVDDPKQLRANLKKVLDGYYEEYGDIIQRPEQQVIDDVIAYAKANGISVAEALKKNFVEPLQSKSEYAQAIADKYGMNPTQSIQNIGDKVALVTKYANGMMSYQILDDVYNPKYDIKTINGKSYMVVDDGNGVPQLKYIGGDGTVLNYASLTQGLQSFMSKYSEDQFYKQKGCGYFVNEYLTDIGDSGHVGSRWEDKKALCKEKDWSKLAIGSVVAYNSGATYQDDNGNTVNAGHVSIVYDYDPSTGKVYLYDVNANGDGKVGYWETNINDPKLYGYYTPETYKTAGSTLPDYYSNLNEYGFVDSMTGNYGQYLMGKLNNVSINRLGGDKVLQDQINNWFKYLETKGKNSDGYIDDLIPLYEEFLETGKTPSTAYMGQLGGVAEFTNQATKYSEKVGYGRNAKVNDMGYYDDLVTLYNSYIREEKIPTEAQVAAYGGLDDFYRTAKNYAKNSGITFTPAEQTKEIEDMRNKWMSSEDYKNIQSSIDSLNNIQAMLKSGSSGYGDYTAVYLLNKLRDPDSVVREQEFANTRNIGGIPDKIFNYFQQLQSGKILNDDQKIQIYNEMNTLMKSKIGTYNSKLKAYRSQALRGGDTSKIGTLYSISNKGSINFGDLTGDMQPIPNMEELQ